MDYKALKITLLFGCTLMSSFSNNANELTDDMKLFQQGIQLATDGNWVKSLDTFRDISKRNPTWLESKNNLAVALYQTGDFEQAKETLEEAANSLHSLKVTLENRKKLYDYSASMAYFKAVDENRKPTLPQLSLIKELIPSQNKELLLPEIGNRIDQIKETLINWSKSWANSNTEQYLAAYSNDFQPSGHIKDLDDWKEQRTIKFRLTKIDKIELAAIQIFLNGTKDKAVTQFVQNYHSRKYRDKVLKQIELVQENNRWLIVSEIVIDQIN